MRGAAWLIALLACGCGRDVTSIGAERSSLRDAGALDAGARDAGADAGADAGDGGLYLEAEDGELSGFTIEEVAEASAGRALLAPDVLSDAMPGTARARFAFVLERAGDYVIWGRVYAPDTVANRFWLQLDGGEPFLWRISTGETWFWDDVHEDRAYGEPLVFALEAGAHELVVANAGPSSRLDRLYFTADGDEPPGNDTPCNPPHSVELAGECVPSCGLAQGNGCGDVCTGREPIVAYDCDVCCRVE